MALRSLFLLFLIFGILPPANTMDARATLELELVAEIQLDENLRATSDQLNGKWIRSGDKFIHSDEQAIVAVVYDMDGQQLAELGERGDRSFQYTAVMDMFATDEEIKLFSEDGRRLTFDKQGEELNEDDLFSDNYHRILGSEERLYALPSNPEDETALYKFEINNRGQVAGNEEIGEVSHEDRWLRNIAFSGGIVTSGEEVYWVTPASVKVNYYKPGNEEIEVFEPELPESWRNTEIEAGSEEIQDDPEILIEFMENRSVMQGLYNLGEEWLLEIGHNHTGEMELLLMDHNFEVTHATTLSPDFLDQFGQRIRMADETGIYFYNETISGDGSFDKVLTRWELVP